MKPLEWVAAGILALALTVSYLAMLRPGLPWGGDTALLILHAKNLAEGKPYAKTPYVYDDEAWMEGGATFPPGLPLLLIPHFTGEPKAEIPFAAMRQQTAVMLAMGSLAVFFFLRRNLGFWFALAATAVIGWNRYTLYFLESIWSEEIYIPISFLAFGVVYWIYQSRRDETNPIPWGLLAGALAVYPYITRSIGISVMVALVLTELYRQRRITKFLLAAGAAFMAITLLSGWLTHSDTAYRSQFRLDPLLTVAHAREYLIRSMEVWLGLPGGRYPRLAFWVVTSSLALVGLVRRLREHGPHLPEFYLCGYFGVLSVYWAANHRYLGPLLPVYVLYVFTALEWLWKSQKHGRRPAAAAVMALMLATGLLYWQSAPRTPIEDGVHTANYRQMLSYIRKETGTADRIVSDSARFLALLTGRPSIFYPMEEASTSQIWQFFQRMEARYILFTKHHADDQKYLGPLIAKHGAELELKLENSEYALYRLSAAPAGQGAGGRQ